MGGAKTLSIIVAANIKGLETSMKQANKSIGSFASNAARLGSMLTFGVTAPLVAMGRTALNTFAEFEDGMAKVKSVTGATDSQFKMLTKNAEELGATTRFTAQQFADLQLVLGRKGFDPSAIKDMTSSIADLALATGSDLSLAAEVVATSINAFNLESTNATSVANTLAMAAANSSIELNTFATAFGHAGASANAVGMELEELAAMMGVLMDNGIKASKAGTGLRKIFMKLHKEGRNFTEVLDLATQGELGLQRAMKLAGVTSANQLLILAKNKDKVAELTRSYETNTTALSDMAGIMEDTTVNKIAVMNSAIDAMNKEFGRLIADSLTPIIKSITEFAKTMKELDDNTKIFIITITSVLTVLGPIGLLLAGVVSFFKSIGIAAAYLGTKLSALFVAFEEIAILLSLGFAEGGLAGAIAAVFGGASVGTILAVAAAISAIVFGLYKLVTSFTDAEESQENFMLTSFKTHKALDELEDKFSIQNLMLKDLAKGTKDLTKFTKDLDKVYKKLGPSKELEAFRTKIFNDVDWDNVGSLGLNNFEEGLIDISEQFEDTVDDIDFEAVRLTLMFDKLKNNLVSFGVTMAQGFSQGFSELFLRVTDSEGAIVSFGQKFEQFGKQFLAQIGVMIIQAAVFAALLSVIFPGQAIAGASFMENFSNLLAGGSGIKGFANGGRPPLNKMSLVGENGPELFNPGSQSGRIIPNDMIGGSVIPDVRISGNDLLIVFNKAQRRKNLR